MADRTPSADVLCQVDNSDPSVRGRSKAGNYSRSVELADELSAAGSQAGDDGLDVLDGQCEMRSTTEGAGKGATRFPLRIADRSSDSDAR